MYYGRKKWITIAIVIIVVIILAIAGTIIVMNTDLFKSDKTLFWKYLGQEFAEQKVENIQLQDIEKMKEQKPYKAEGELTATSTDENVNKSLGKIKLKTEQQVDKQNDYAHVKAKLNYANATIFNLDYANVDDIYALKSDEIVTVYVGVRNENLKVLFQKLGVTDTNAIPDTIVPIDYTELLKISDEEMQHIQETYTDIIINNIPDDNYSKQTEAIIEKDGVSYNTTSYRLDLSGTEISNILVNVLNTLKTDSITLNLITTKASTLGLDEKYTSIDGINDVIDELIEKIQNTEFTDTSFVVYNYKGETIATEILVRNKQKMTIYNEKGNIKVVVEDLTGNSTYTTVSMDILYTITSTHSNINVKLTADEYEMLELNITTTGSATQGELQTELDATITNEDNEAVSLSYNQTLQFVSEIENMENLDETNCAILNDYPQEQLILLIQALAQQVTNVLNQKIQIIGQLF